jgi:hypothetical protein
MYAAVASIIVRSGFSVKRKSRPSVSRGIMGVHHTNSFPPKPAPSMLGMATTLLVPAAVRNTFSVYIPDRPRGACDLQRQLKVLAERQLASESPCH